MLPNAAMQHRTTQHDAKQSNATQRNTMQRNTASIAYCNKCNQGRRVWLSDVDYGMGLDYRTTVLLNKDGITTATNPFGNLK